MPAEGIKLLRHEDILTFDEITAFTETAVKCGIHKVRITGGEPLVRKGITTLVKMIAGIDGITDLSMTTNALLLKDYATGLKKAGLQRVNISLDTTDPQKYSWITRGGDINAVFEGIETAREAGLLPIKINCVIENSEDEPDAKLVARFCREQAFEIRYILRMDLVNGYFSKVVGGSGGDCRFCNRLRLTASGKLKPCLFDDLEFDIREMPYDEAFKKAVSHKPECGSCNLTGNFYNIGG
jgi:cyclic pyranopterin phosphate synthase